jgi:hypothetical protein
MSAVFGISVNCDPVDILLDLLENSNGRVPARAARERFGDALVYLEQIGAVQPDARLTEVTCNECQLHHSAPLEFDTSTKAYRFFCPRAGFVGVRDADLASLCVTPGWLSGWLARTLSLLPHIRHRTLIENQAWLLGETVLDGTSVAVALLLGRLAANEQEVLIRELSRFHPSEIGIVLTTSADLSHTLVGQVDGRFRLDALGLDQHQGHRRKQSLSRHQSPQSSRVSAGWLFGQLAMEA